MIIYNKLLYYGLQRLTGLRVMSRAMYSIAHYNIIIYNCLIVVGGFSN